MQTALLVDDNEDVRLLLRFALERAGYAVTEAGGGGEALVTLAAGAIPDVVVLDLQMPDMDGWETLRRIRSQPATAAVPVLICTVKSMPDDRNRGHQLGCDGYLTKPFDPRTVAGAVTAAIAARKNYEEEAIWKSGP